MRRIAGARHVVTPLDRHRALPADSDPLPSMGAWPIRRLRSLHQGGARSTAGRPSGPCGTSPLDDPVARLVLDLADFAITSAWPIRRLRRLHQGGARSPLDPPKAVCDATEPGTEMHLPKFFIRTREDRATHTEAAHIPGGRF